MPGNQKIHEDLLKIGVNLHSFLYKYQAQHLISPDIPLRSYSDSLRFSLFCLISIPRWSDLQPFTVSIFIHKPHFNSTMVRFTVPKDTDTVWLHTVISIPRWSDLQDIPATMIHAIIYFNSTMVWFTDIVTRLDDSVTAEFQFHDGPIYRSCW